MAETIGARLRTARQARGLSVEDAAHETRIHATNIRGMENDDYSGFANITYAKSFLSLYSRFLGVEAGDALGQFSGTESSASAGTGRTFLEPIGERIESGPRRSFYQSSPRSSDTSSPGGAPILLGLICLLLLIAIPTLWYIGKNAESPEEVTSKLKELANAKLTETDPKAAGKDGENNSDPKGQTATVETPIENSNPPDQPAPKPTAKPVSSDTTASVSEPSAGGTASNPTTPGRSTMEFDIRTRKPVVRPPLSSPTPPASTSVPIRATPLIARPFVVPTPEEDTPEEGAGETEDETSSDRRNRYPRPPG